MNVFAELLDRPVAELLRDAIDAQAVLPAGKRAIIVTDVWWLREERLQSLPTIAIGGPPSNATTERIAKRVESDPELGDHALQRGIVHPPGGLDARAALWGASAAETAECVRTFIAEDLQGFISDVWR